jgi:hypothetical protein
MGFDLPVVLSDASDFKYSVIGSRHTGQYNLGSRQDLAALVSPRGFHSRISYLYRQYNRSGANSDEKSNFEPSPSATAKRTVAIAAQFDRVMSGYG